MDFEVAKRLTGQWIMGMIFENSQDIEYLVKHGCKRMIFGITYDEIMDIIDILVGLNKISVDELSGTLSLTAKGYHEVKRHTILPLLELAGSSKYHDAFMIANQNKCDMEFLQSIMSQDEFGIIESIHKFIQNNLHKLNVILEQITIFKLAHKGEESIYGFGT